METLTFENKQGIGMVTINRPNKRNAIDYDVMTSLQQIISHTKDDDAVKGLVITGKGYDAFCSGGDLSVFHSLKTADEAYAMLNKMGMVLIDLFTYPKPTIALINGVAVGGGAEIAAACDFRLAANHARIGFIQGKLGITTGWGGASFLYERISGMKAMELLMSAEQITAEEAYQIGLYQEVSDFTDLDKLLMAYIERYLNKPIEVLKAYKQLFLRRTDLVKLKENVISEIKECSILWESEAHHQAVTYFLNNKS